MKKIICLLLCILLIFSTFSVVTFANVVDTSTTGITEADFQNKISRLMSVYRNGEYWNSASSNGTFNCTGKIPCNGIGCTTGVPCTTRGYCGDSNGTGCTCACGAYVYNGVQLCWQCMGFAFTMARECFGGNPYYDWPKTTSMGTIHAGDVVRINIGHSIFIYKVIDNTVYYCDCNYTGPCQVRWGASMSLSELASKFSYKNYLPGNNLTGNGNTHICNSNIFVSNQSSHPHYSCYKCSICGKATVDTNTGHYDSNCSECNHIINIVPYEGDPYTLTKKYTFPLSLPTDNKIAYDFIGWSTIEGDNKAEFPVGNPYNNDTDATLFPIFEPKPGILTYDANGGEDAPSNQNYIVDEEFEISENKPNKDGSYFIGWCDRKDGKGDYYNPRGRITCPRETKTLYAQWYDMFTTDKFSYHVNDNNEAVINMYWGKTEYLEIPEKIDNHIVTGISISDGNITKLKLPSTISYINTEVVNCCENLQQIIIDSSNKNLKVVDNVVYDYNKTKLLLYLSNKTDTEFEMPDSVISIEEYAFNGNNYLKKLTVSKNIETIGDNALRNCQNLSHIIFPGTKLKSDIFHCGMGFYDIIDTDEYGWFNYIAYGKHVKDFTISAYKGTSPQKYFTDHSIWLFDNAKFEILGTTDDYQRYEYELLSDGTVTLCEDYEATIIYPLGKDYDSSLGISGKYEIPDTIDGYKVSKIRNGFMNYCPWFTEIIIPDGVVDLGYGSFSLTNNLEKLYLSNTLVMIGGMNFGNAKIKSITIPSSVKTIRDVIFVNANNLTNINIDSNTMNEIGDCFYFTSWHENFSDGEIYTNNILLEYKGDYPETDEKQTINIKDGTKIIGSNLYSQNKNIVDVIIPNSVHSIGSRAFSFCNNLKSVYIPKSVKYIGNEAFIRMNDQHERLHDFTILGYPNTAAEKCAKDNGFTFVDVSVRQTGDADKDEKVTIVDTTKVQQYLVDLIKEKDIDQELSDNNGDNKVSIVDATRIEQYLVELIPDFLAD